MTIDNLGYLWIAMWDGSKVICIDPLSYIDSNINKPITILYEIDLPVTRPTNCTFAGPNLNLLYITTAQDDISDQSGYLYFIDFREYNLPNRGLPTNLLEL